MKPGRSQSGIAYWMLQVSIGINNADKDLDSKTVHDLRVALRRCRALGDGFRQIDPDKSWKKMRRQGAALFDSLGELRDCHVMQQWVTKLGEDGDPATAALLSHTERQEDVLQEHAKQALHHFDQKRWKSLAATLSRRSARLRPGSSVFQALALEKWMAARKLENAALRTGNATDFHRLRIAVKKFRYVVENFLPQHEQEWTSSLKKIQDLLGEIHDLDVLMQTAQAIGAFATPDSRQFWEALIQGERGMRVEHYKSLMLGEDSFWKLWRSGLPRGRESRHASLTKLQAWSSYLDSDVRHSRRISRFALRIYDGLVRSGVIKGEEAKARERLHAAALVHEVGRSEQKNGHHKRTERMVAGMDPLPGWSRLEVEIIARIARYHRGALPGNSVLREFPPAQRRSIMLLSGILRLANALDAEHDGAIRRINISCRDHAILIHADGFQPNSGLAETIAAGRYLLELSCGMPVIMKPLQKRRAATSANSAKPPAAS